MRIIIKDNYEQISKQAALLVSSMVRLKPDTVLGLPTGGTPKGMYDRLIEMNKNDEIDFSEVKTFNLDEYYRINPDNPQSYHYYMKNNFFNHINIKKENYNIPDGTAEDVKKECLNYEKKIKESGGIDLQILGIGSNGHIGFNEPGKQLNTATHLINLTQKTIEDNSRFFESEEEVPTQALTAGMSTILKSRKIILLASGENKAEAIKKTTNNKITTKVPSSLLQTHPDMTLIIDKEAAKHL